MCMITVVAEQKVAARRIATMAARREGVEIHNFLNRNKPTKLMKFSNQLTRTHFASLSTIALLAGACGILSEDLRAADQTEAQLKPPIAQRLFASSDEAVKALQAAAESKDKAGLREIFGPEVDELLTGDKVQDANNAEGFATAMAQGCKPVNEGEDKISLEIGTNEWPLPIPLVKVDGQWHFDTAAGKEEIIDRHIGKDELHAIGVCQAYVVAQRQYAGANPEAGGEVNYAQKFKSTTGKKDGLYWQAAENEPASPFGLLVAEADAEGYDITTKGTGPHPFHGYYFRILTRQGPDAPGGKIDYMSQDKLTGGFALLAYPERWDKSGIMTFIVNQDGKIFEQNLGEKTSQIAGALKEYNPDSHWAQVQDKGVLSAVSEK